MQFFHIFFLRPVTFFTDTGHFSFNYLSISIIAYKLFYGQPFSKFLNSYIPYFFSNFLLFIMVTTSTTMLKFPYLYPSHSRSVTDALFSLLAKQEKYDLANKSFLSTAIEKILFRLLRHNLFSRQVF